MANLHSAKDVLREAQYNNTKTWREVKRALDEERCIQLYEEIWKIEKKRQMKVLNQRRRRKIVFLIQKYAPSLKETPNEIRGIIIKDQDLPETFTSEPRCYGGCVLDANETKIMLLPPKYAVFDKIDPMECEGQVEKGIAKLRWSIKNEEQNENEEHEPVFDVENKTFDLRNMRATDQSFNSRITLPRAIDDDHEIAMHNLKARLKKITGEYVTKNNNIRFHNLNVEERKGAISLKKRIKSNDIVIFQTDKSGRFSVDKPENYNEACQPHVRDDNNISREDHDKIECLLNAHGEFWTRILAAGEFTGHEDRIRNNMKSENCPVSPLYALRKDHKLCENNDIGPPTRPVCGVNSSVNDKMSHLLSTILSEVWKRDEGGSVCMNTEEMSAEIARINKDHECTNMVVGSTDVKALYPNLDIDFTIEKVCEVFSDSRIEISGVDFNELGLYLSLNMTIEELTSKQIHVFCPTRKTKRGRPPTITASGTANDKTNRFASWNTSVQTPNEKQQRVMLTEGLRVALQTVMKNHVYQFDKQIKKQSRGGPIGLELTGHIAQVFMIWWDNRIRKDLTNAGVNILLYKRYVDDVNWAIEPIPPGLRYREHRLDFDDYIY